MTDTTGGRFVHIPHRHARPPVLSGLFTPVGTVWACKCGHRYTRTVGADGQRYWHEGPLPVPPRYTDDLAGALAFIRDEANRQRRALGLAPR